MVAVVRVIGAGAMGRGIAQVAAAAGVDVEIADTSAGAVASAVEFAAAMLRRSAEKGQRTQAAAQAAIERIQPIAAPDAPSQSVDLVIEAVIEDASVKRELLRRIEVALPDAVLASNTSSLSITDMAAALGQPGRLLGMHFFNPVPLMRLVELIPGVHTDPRAITVAESFIDRIGYTAVRCRDSPGFLVNHIGRALVTEAFALLAEQVAGVEVIDQLARDCIGLKMGPFELLDLTGLDVSHAVTEIISAGFYGEPRLRPSPVAALRVAAGLLGRKTGRGFYDHSEERAPEPAPPAPDASAVAVHVVGLEALAQRLKAAGVTILEEASAEAVSIVGPIGEPTYRAAQREGLDTRRTLGVDPLTVDTGRLAVILSPQTDPALARRTLAALAASGVSLGLTTDGPAPVVQRLVATIVNLGCAVAERGIAAPVDIEAAARLGLGYPRGPLALGELYGPALIVRILDGMASYTGDPRYRVSGWLRAHTECGMPLGDIPMTPDQVHRSASTAPAGKSGTGIDS